MLFVDANYSDSRQAIVVKVFAKRSCVEDYFPGFRRGVEKERSSFFVDEENSHVGNVETFFAGANGDDVAGVKERFCGFIDA